eukprot:scaffold5860_cov103-Isochrysis_galbana.AAC.4
MRLRRGRRRQRVRDTGGVERRYGAPGSSRTGTGPTTGGWGQAGSVGVKGGVRRGVRRQGGPSLVRCGAMGGCGPFGRREHPLGGVADGLRISEGGRAEPPVVSLPAPISCELLHAAAACAEARLEGTPAAAAGIRAAYTQTASTRAADTQTVGTPIAGTPTPSTKIASFQTVCTETAGAPTARATAVGRPCPPRAAADEPGRSEPRRGGGASARVRPRALHTPRAPLHTQRAPVHSPRAGTKRVGGTRGCGQMPDRTLSLHRRRRSRALHVSGRRRRHELHVPRNGPWLDGRHKGVQSDTSVCVRVEPRGESVELAKAPLQPSQEYRVGHRRAVCGARAVRRGVVRSADPADTREQRECLGRVDAVLVAQGSAHGLQPALELGLGLTQPNQQRDGPGEAGRHALPEGAHGAGGGRRAALRPTVAAAQPRRVGTAAPLVETTVALAARHLDRLDGNAQKVVQPPEALHVMVVLTEHRRALRSRCAHALRQQKLNEGVNSDGIGGSGRGSQ